MCELVLTSALFTVSAYSCYGSWEEDGTWYTIVLRNKSSTEKETLCVSMRATSSIRESPGKMGSVEQQELWLSRPQSFCHRNSAKQWTYKLANQGLLFRLSNSIPNITKVIF